jgi:predicted alpha/beta superfamily hydrolase
MTDVSLQPAAPEAPPEGSTWRHDATGNVYRVAVLTNKDAKKPEKYPPTVVYFNVVTDTWWSLPVSQWHDGRTRIDA